MDQDTLNIASRDHDPAGEATPVRVLQITDCHLHADPNWTLAGINTQTSFEWVMSLAEQFRESIDLLLLTGDLVHDASVAGYTRLKQQIERFGVPACCLPGNHDVPEVLSTELQGGLVSSPKTVRMGNWVIILLDSTLPHSEGGHLSGQELERLQETLQAYPDSHVLIALHHHPVLISSAWMDKMALDNPEPFLELIEQHKSVKGVIWGHIHQTFESDYRGVRMMGTPSTCIQFVENQDSFGLSTAPPGFRWLELGADGRIDSGIERVDALPPGLDLKTAGY
ncbi:MAG: 3',5'-cyclic-AMP phosphodiesterase [Sedimenticola sp.]|nr:3',5'-cyclic-AMP phosphodiesterase [Sedimenticola sp.]